MLIFWIYHGPFANHPNQIRHFGIPVSDDPYDGSRPFGIDHENLFIPFETDGSTVFFDSYVPSDEELEQSPHIILTDDETLWDPAGILMSSNRPYGNNMEVIVQQLQSKRELCKVQR